MKEDIFVVSGAMGKALATKAAGKKTVSQDSAMSELHGGVQDVFWGRSNLFSGSGRKTCDGHGLFMFPETSGLSPEEKEEEEKKYQKQMMDLMYMYQAYHNFVQTRPYASRGSKLVCRYGAKPALLDTLEDHGVYIGTSPVMTCIDCREWNIHNFGSCMSPETLYKERLPMTVPTHPNGKQADIAPYNHYPHICVPLISPNDAWYQVETSVFLEQANGVAYQSLKEDAFLVCQYGGIITISEVPGEDAQNQPKYKQYVVIAQKINVRRTPSIKADTICQLEVKKRISIITDEESPIYAEGRLWRKVDVTDLGYEGTGWVADDYILPEKTIVTKGFQKEIVYKTIYDDGRVESEIKLLEDCWHTPANVKAPEKTRGRYNVAIGPKVMNPRYPNGGKILEDDFDAFSRDINVIIKNKNPEKAKDEGEITLECYVHTWKAHTYCRYQDPNYLDEYEEKNVDFTVRANVKSGIYQTGILYPCVDKEDHDEWAEDHVDGSVIEFFPNRLCVEREKKIKLSDYKLIRVEVDFNGETD